MNDADLETTLRRYRVVDPPPSLAARIAAPRIERRVGHVWGAMAAAAVVVIWVAAHLTARTPHLDPVRESNVAAVTEALGGGEDARQYAEAIVPRREPVLASELLAEATW